jgi:hypothetical protein
MRSFTFATWLALAVLPAMAEDTESSCTYTELQSLPDWFSSSRIVEPYRISCRLNPFHLRGDFDGDAQPDLAVLVSNTQSGKHGIAIACRVSDSLTILGAGIPLGNGGDDFVWMDVWRIGPPPAQANVEGDPVPEFRGQVLHLEKSESASGWAGMVEDDRFVWYQGGD